MSRRVEVYDTTLRDGTQAEGLSPTVGDKLRVARLLDRLGVDFIEGGWPGANPKDDEFFARAQTELELDTSILVAFGSTRRPRSTPDKDDQLARLLDANTEVVCIVGKSWDRHVLHALNTSLEEGVAMVAESVEFLRTHGRRVFFDAEHFFDGYLHNPEFALSVLDAAAAAGAERLVLCDTNGGSLPQHASETVKALVPRFDVPLGVHFHNDGACAVANSLAAVQAGAHQVQGCVNGYGERTGNADLCSVIPNLVLKMGHSALPIERLDHLYTIAHEIAEIMNSPVATRHPYVGSSAFAHKAGLHTSGLARLDGAYEHIDPALVGNTARQLFSELMGRATLLQIAGDRGWTMNEELAQTIVDQVKDLEHQGYQFEAADGSFELLARRAAGWEDEYFELKSLVVTINTDGDGTASVTATLHLRVDGQDVESEHSGDGPVHAMDQALRSALEPGYPELAEVHLTDYKVRDLDSSDGTAARVRVLIETSDGDSTWGTVGVHQNIIEASWEALSDGVRIGLLRANQ